MTRQEAIANHAAARKNLDVATAAVRNMDLNDTAAAQSLMDRRQEAETAYKVAMHLRTKYAPAI